MPIGGIGTGTISIGGAGTCATGNWSTNPPRATRRRTRSSRSTPSRKAAGRGVARAIEGPHRSERLRRLERLARPQSRAAALSRVQFRRGVSAGAGAAGRCGRAAASAHRSVQSDGARRRGDERHPRARFSRFVLINPTATADRRERLRHDRKLHRLGRRLRQGQQERQRIPQDRAQRACPCGLFMHSTGLDPKNPAWGTLALATTSERCHASHRLGGLELGRHAAGFLGRLFLRRQARRARRASAKPPFGSLAASTTVPANGEARDHVPHRLAFPQSTELDAAARADRQLLHHAIRRRVGRRRQDRAQARDAGETHRRASSRAFVDSDMPAVIKEAALLQRLDAAHADRLPHRRRPVLRLGRLQRSRRLLRRLLHARLELRTRDRRSSSARSRARCAKSSSATHRRRGPDELPHRTCRSLKAQEMTKAAADGQMGTHHEALSRLAAQRRRADAQDPLAARASKALEFAWIPGGWDADRDGVMEGCQHNTMDVEYFGPNPEMGTWYLGALRAAEEMAKHLGETEFAARLPRPLRRAAARGSTRISSTANTTSTRSARRASPTHRRRASRVGMGATTSPSRCCSSAPAASSISSSASTWPTSAASATCSISRTSRRRCASIMKYNFRDNFFGHFNHLRSYALGDESGPARRDAIRKAGGRAALPVLQRSLDRPGIHRRRGNALRRADR